MSDSLLQRSVTTGVARHLTHTHKTSPKMMSITPRWLISLLPWVQVEGGTYRVNRTKVELSKAARIEIDWADDRPVLSSEALRSVPLFAGMHSDLLERMVRELRVETVLIGNRLIEEGKGPGKFFVIAEGQVEVLSKGVHGSDLRLALLSDGEFLARRNSCPRGPRSSVSKREPPARC